MMSDIKTGHTNGDIRLRDSIKTDEEWCIAPGDLCFYLSNELEDLGLIVMVMAVATAQEVYLERVAFIDSWGLPEVVQPDSDASRAAEARRRGEMMAQCLIEGKLKWITFEQLEKIEDES